MIFNVCKYIQIDVEDINTTYWVIDDENPLWNEGPVSNADVMGLINFLRAMLRRPTQMSEHLG